MNVFPSYIYVALWVQEYLHLLEAAVVCALLWGNLQGGLSALGVASGCVIAGLPTTLAGMAHVAAPAVTLAAQGGILAAFALSFGDFVAQVHAAAQLSIHNFKIQ